MLWSPLVGAALAGIATAVLVVSQRIYHGPLLGSALAILTLGVLTRGLHLDGLADTVDGLSSRQPAERALAIMREGPIGALGAAAVIGALGVDVIALATSAQTHRGTQALVFAVVTGRLTMVWSCTRGVRAARADGMGALVAGSVGRIGATAWTFAMCIGAGLYGRFDGNVGSVHGAVRGVAAVVAALVVAWIVRRHATRRLGGITGDVLGAVGEIATTVSLLVTAIGH